MAAPGNDPFSITSNEVGNLFKTHYGERSEAAYNNSNMLLARIRNKNDFTGKMRVHSNPLGFAGGIGAGELPKAHSRRNAQSSYTAKRVYARAYIEREAIYASRNNKGAFVAGLTETVTETVEAHSRNMSMILHGDGTGTLGRIHGSNKVRYVTDASGATVSTSATSFIRVPMDTTTSISRSGFVPAWFEEGDLLNLIITITSTSNGVAAKANQYRVENVSPSGNFIVISLEAGSWAGLATAAAATNGSGAALTASGFCLQNSFEAVPQGLVNALLPATSGGSLYGINRQRRWSGLAINAGGGIDQEHLNEVVTKQGERKSLGNLMVTSPVQVKRLKDLGDSSGSGNSLKRYEVGGRRREGISAKLQQIISFSGTSYMTEKGPIPIFADRFCPPDRFYFLNDSMIWCDKRPGSGWFMDDGTRFLRDADADRYEARYGVYCENYIKPTWQACLYGLTSTY